MKDSVEDPGGDLRAVEGTDAEVAILTDRPLVKGELMLGDDRHIDLKAGEGNWVTAHVTLDKDGLYHIADIDRG
jgi:exoribonuclease II